jgi:hypothetical protein
MGAWISMMTLSTLSSYARSDNTLLPCIPPASQTAYQLDRDSSYQCSTSPLVIANSEDMDPLIAAGFRNLAHSPLCRLPEELLLDIMKRLDIVSIQCLRRVSRLFLRLFSSPTFRSSCDNSNHPLDSYEHWYEPTRSFTWSKEFQVLLDKDLTDYCENCRTRRTHPSWTSKSNVVTTTYLHCSGCCADHPACLFSKIQRSTPSKTRVCIGREGFVRVCEHQVVTWKEVIQTGLQLARLDTEFATVFLKKCHRESHFPRHHVKDTSLINRQQIYPEIHITGSRKRRVYIDLTWDGHLYLPDTGFDEEGYNKIATPSLIREQLKQFRQGTAEFIVPEFSPGRLIEMHCFDPNRCSCLRYAGVEQLPKGWQLTPDQGPEFLACKRQLYVNEEFEHLACRRYPSSRLGPLRSFQINQQESLQGEQKRIESHFTATQTTGTIRHGSSRVTIRIQPCPSEVRCLQIHYNRRITIIPEVRTGCITWAWCQALDPDSYKLTDDDQTFGILWCRQPNCKNYYRYLRKAPFPLRDTNRACGKSCSLR